jgi:hypothetical protein
MTLLGYSATSEYAPPLLTRLPEKLCPPLEPSHSAVKLGWFAATCLSVAFSSSGDGGVVEDFQSLYRGTSLCQPSVSTRPRKISRAPLANFASIGIPSPLRLGGVAVRAGALSS